MTIPAGPDRHVEWRLPERRLSGPAHDVASEFAQLIVTLVALRGVFRTFDTHGVVT